MSLDRFVGKVAVITGTSSGIGRATAEALVKRGLIVAGLARRVERVEELAKELKNEKGKLYSFKTDLTKEDEIISTFKKITETLGPIHVLINNAGVGPETNLIDGDISKWRQTLDTNVLALCIATREAIASMKANNIKGHIIHINSTTGHYPIEAPGLSVYPASKYAVTALTESLRREINRNKLPIKITSLSPGFVKTEIIEANFSAKGAERFKNRPGLETEDIADNIVYVLSTPEHVNIKELTVMIQGQLG
ncbi:farnesol dehydrogenase-like [Sitophilus oryzae]|uniref:Farnesol dehydrogenase-like n=1 Tax=Sitophilus oryzae TaxID=7048 RepID=A0A6J2XIT7_SITOR|nr:farnesol dehydrogenase-like [Sitophilus oryzae]